jgi:hypothetical protein
MRELEQCVRNIVFRGAYWPPQLGAPGAANQTLTADELLQNYCASVQAQTRSYQETGRLLHLDPRTVRTKVSAWSRRQRNGPHE